MPDYTIRVVLHGATAEHYDVLHSNMATVGARRTITRTDGLAFDLPDGEYILSDPLSVDSVRDRVLAIANLAKPQPEPSVLVSHTKQWAWQLRPTPGQS